MSKQNSLKVLAIVPARGGSKGLPKKNLRPLCGRPLINWSIDTALACEEIDVVVVSTDDTQIAAVAAAAGAEVPFLRPPDLANDTASSIDVVLHALDFLERNKRFFDVVLLLEPTSPLREVGDIQTALQRIADMEASAVVSVCRAESAHPAFMFRIIEHDRLDPFLSLTPTGVRRQEIDPLFYLEGTLYASTVASLREQRSFYHEGTMAYEVAKWKALEIDDIWDFEMIEAIARYKGLA
ncbi:MAG: acylneuraminate cytidylyltransferase family protein [Pseudomonadota bacterium]|nr:acylneuraminate cytidylyltransferase family protein [Pseudomonadota bacterium]